VNAATGLLTINAAVANVGTSQIIATVADTKG